MSIKSKSLVNKAVALAVSVPLVFSLASCSGKGEGTSKEQVAAGLVKVFKATPQIANNLSDEQIQNIGNCFADEVDSKISEESKKKIADGTDIKREEKDYQAVYDASEKCTKAELTKRK